MAYAWVVVADSARARIFSLEHASGPLQPVEDLVSPEARLKEQDLSSDRPGRSFDSMGQGRHAMGATVEPGKQENVRFAKHVTDYVQAAHNEGRCDRVLLVAGSPMLGILRENLKSLSSVEISEFDKNLGQYDAAEIRKHLPERL